MTIRSGSREIDPARQVASGEIDEHTDHDAEWLWIDPVDGMAPLSIEIWHGPAGPSDDDEPHWRMRLELWALTEDGRLLPCQIDLPKATNYSTRRVPHLNFEDDKRSSGAIPFVV